MDDTFFMRAGWLIDGSGKPAARDILLKVENGIITGVAPFRPDGLDGSRLDGDFSPFYDFADFSVLPGLVDAHVHLCWSGTSDPDIRSLQVEPDENLAETAITRHVRAHLAHGVFAVRDGGDKLGRAAGFRAEHTGTLVIKAAGRAWHKPGRYGSLIGRAVPEGLSLGGAILDDPAPGDHVKVVQSGLNSLKVFGRPCKAQFDLNELTAAVSDAKSLGLSVMAHANGPEAVEIAVKAGCASVEHGFFMGRENLRRLADTPCVWVPTSVTMTGYSQSLPRDSQETQVALKMLDHQLEQMSFALGLGVKMAVGTDSGCQGVFHGAAVSQEMENFMRAGFSAEGAVRAAAFEGARLLGIFNAGEIVKGRDATLVVAPGPPECLFASLKNPAAFFIKGRMISG